MHQSVLAAVRSQGAWAGFPFPSHLLVNKAELAQVEELAW